MKRTFPLIWLLIRIAFVGLFVAIVVGGFTKRKQADTQDTPMVQKIVESSMYGYQFSCPHCQRTEWIMIPVGVSVVKYFTNHECSMCGSKVDGSKLPAAEAPN